MRKAALDRFFYSVQFQARPRELRALFPHFPTRTSSLHLLPGAESSGSEKEGRRREKESERAREQKRQNFDALPWPVDRRKKKHNSFFLLFSSYHRGRLFSRRSNKEYCKLSQKESTDRGRTKKNRSSGEENAEEREKEKRGPVSLWAAGERAKSSVNTVSIFSSTFFFPFFFSTLLSLFVR